MPVLESLGLGTGVLSSELLTKLLNAEREGTELRLDARSKLVEAKITAYGEAKSRMAKLQTAALTLSSPSLTGATKVTSSDESILTAEGSVAAVPGSYNVEVLNTAKSHALASGLYSSLDEIVGTGKLVFSFGELSYDGADNLSGQTANASKAGKTLTIDSSNNSLAGIRDAINQANFGVTANIVKDGSGYRLQITSTDTGVENGLRIEAQDASGNVLSTGLGALSYTETHQNLTQTSKGEDAQVRVNGLTISRSSNSIEEVIRGVTLNLKSADVGKNINVNVSSDIEGLTKTLQDFVTSYNDLKEFVDANMQFDKDTQQGGIFLGDSTMRNMMSQIRAMISKPIVGINGSYRALTELGIDTNRHNKYLLDFNPAILDKALKSSRSSVIGLLSKTGTTTDSGVTYMNDSVNTKPGTYGVNITQLATQAKYQGGSVAGLDFSSPVVIDVNNNKFTINVNGKSANIELQQGSYATGEELARQIALKINSSDSLSSSGNSVSVVYNSTNKSFDLTSNKYGSSSQVSFTSVSPNTANTLGFNAIGSGAYQGVGLTALNAEAFAGKGASSLPGADTVASTLGINFAANNATFSLNIDGAGPVAVTVNQNANGIDLNGDGVHGDRKDSLQAVQSAIDATSLNGQVTAQFDSNGYLIFTTTGIGAGKSIEVTGVGNTDSDTKLGLKGDQGVVQNGKDVGLVLGSNVEFNVKVDNTSSTTKVSVPAGTYNTGADLAAAVQAALNNTLATDPAFSGAVTGASTATGTRDISTVNFATAPAGFSLNLNGQIKDIVVNGADPDPIVNVQAALDAAYGAGVVTASLDGSGLKLSSVATGHQQYIEVLGDGRGAHSSSFADLSSGLDFSGSNNASFDLTVDGVTLNVNVAGNGTLGSNDSQSNLNTIQQAIDSALAASGQFSAGDVVAKVDDSGKLYFETQSKNGVKTANTFGANASLSISNLNANATNLLGMTGEVQNNGQDSFGLARGERTFGYDLAAQVDYQYDSDSRQGSLKISVGGLGTRVSFSDLDNNAIAFLGLQDSAYYQPQVARGKDVEGTIDGVVGVGEGQYLRAADGNEKAINGYYLGNESANFSDGVVIDSSNDTFKIAIDGVEAEITLAHGPYTSGTAMASALQAAINEHATFKGKGLGVKVEYTDDANSITHHKFGIISATKGSASSVRITEANAAVAAALGFVNGIGGGEIGKDQVGEPSHASGIRLKISGSTLGDRGSVTFVSGFGDQLKGILSSFLNGATSVMAGRSDALNKETDSIAYDRSRMESRLSAMEARLKASFMYNDAIAAKLYSTLDFVKMQFEAMNKSKK